MASHESGNDIKDKTIFTLVKQLETKDQEIAELKRRNELTTDMPRARVAPLDTDKQTDATTQTGFGDVNQYTIISDVHTTVAASDAKIKRGANAVVRQWTKPMVFETGMVVSDSATNGRLSRQEPNSTEIDKKTSPNSGPFHFQTSFQNKTWVEEKLKEVEGAPDEQRRRGCLQRAIRENCKDIVDILILPWTDSYLPDFLYQHGCLLKEEDLSINDRHLGRMNQIRCLIGVLLNKDYRSLLVFISFILEFDPDLGKQILDVFTRVLNDGGETADKCASCLLIHRVDITYLIDDLFSKDMIDQQFYLEVSQSDGGCQNDMWERFQRQVWNNGNHKIVTQVVVDALSRIECHSDIIQMLRNDLEDHRNSFQCRCGKEHQMQLLKLGEVDDGDETW